MTQDTSGKPVLRDTPQSLAMSPGTKERLLLSLDMNPDIREKLLQSLDMSPDTKEKLLLQSPVMNPDTRERLLQSLDMNPDTREKPVPTDTLQNLHPPDTSVAQSAGDKEGPGVGG